MFEPYSDVPGCLPMSFYASDVCAGDVVQRNASEHCMNFHAISHDDVQLCICVSRDDIGTIQVHSKIHEAVLAFENVGL